MANVTVWDTFFMIVTVIPVSKMFSSIFMKMVARVGTVNQEKWAAIGLGALGATYGLMKMSGVFGGTAGGQSGVAGLSGGGGAPGAGVAPGGSSGPMGGMPSAVGAGMGMNIQSSMGPSGLYSAWSNQSGAAGQESSSPISSSAGRPPGYGSTASGLLVPSGTYGGGNDSVGSGAATSTGAQEAGSAAGALNGQPPGGIPERGGRSLGDIVNIASNTGNRFARGAAVVGMATSLPVPGVAPVMAGLYGVSGKAVAGLSSTAYHVSQEIRERKKNGQDFWGAMQGMTGTSNRIVATTRLASTLAMAPMGRRVTAIGTQAPGRAYQFGKAMFGRI